MRGNSIAIALFAAWIFLGVTNSAALGDGGAMRFSERRSDRIVTVFTSPTPLRAGPVDVSVLVQDADSGKPVLDASIMVNAHPVDHPQNGTSAPATTDAATNKLLHAAQLEFSESGRWHLEVNVQGLSAERPIGFEVEAAEPLPPWLHLGAWIAWPLVPIGLFACHQWLDQRRRRVSGGAFSSKSPPAQL